MSLADIIRAHNNHPANALNTYSQYPEQAVLGMNTPFETGVCVIKHWKIHNLIQKDRYKPTVYVEHKDKLVIPNDMPQTKDAYFGLAEIAFGLAVFVGLSYFIINVVNK